MNYIYTVIGVVIIAAILYPFVWGIREDIETIREIEEQERTK